MTIENVFFYLIFTLTHLVFGFLIFVYIYIYIHIYIYIYIYIYKCITRLMMKNHLFHVINRQLNGFTKYDVRCTKYEAL